MHRCSRRSDTSPIKTVIRYSALLLMTCGVCRGKKNSPPLRVQILLSVKDLRTLRRATLSRRRAGLLRVGFTFPTGPHPHISSFVFHVKHRYKTPRLRTTRVCYHASAVVSATRVVKKKKYYRPDKLN